MLESANDLLTFMNSELHNMLGSANDLLTFLNSELHNMLGSANDLLTFMNSELKWCAVIISVCDTEIWIFLNFISLTINKRIMTFTISHT